MISDLGENLIFIIGQPRSGTTLLGQILGASPNVYYPSELWLALPAVKLLNNITSLHKDGASEVLATIARNENLTDADADELCAKYLVSAYNRILSRAKNCSVLLDKTPRYYGIIPTLSRLLPRARFLLISRNPLDVAASHKTTWGLDLISLSTPDGIEDATFDIYCAPAFIADARDNNLGGRFYWVSYEDLVRSPEDSIPALCQFAGIDYSDNLLTYDNDNILSKRQRESLLGDKKIWEYSSIHTNAIDNWKNDLSDQEVELVCSIVGKDVFQRLGYEIPFQVTTDQNHKELLMNAFVARQYGVGRSELPVGSPEELWTLRENIAHSERLHSELCVQVEDLKCKEVKFKSEIEVLSHKILSLRSEHEKSLEQLDNLKVVERTLVDTEDKLDVAQKDLDALHTLWPWMNEVREADTSVPRISIITPSFNQAEWIEETILSILAQNYPNFEHIIVDGGSTDGTKEIIKRYPHIHFIQEPDLGQTHAINKGILLSSGEIIAYLNSDDLYRPGCFNRVADILSKAEGPKLLFGSCDYIDESGQFIGHMKARLDNYWDLQRYWGWDRWYCIPQQSVFWKREVLSVTGLFDVRHQYTMDYEMWLRMISHYHPIIIDDTLAEFRLHSKSKTVAEIDSLHLDHRSAARRHWPSYWHLSRWYLECVSLIYTSVMLINIAEFLALDKGLRKRPLLLLVKAAAHCPLLVMDPRFLLIIVTTITSRSFIRKPIEVTHRAYRAVHWRVIRKILKT